MYGISLSLIRYQVQCAPNFLAAGLRKKTKYLVLYAWAIFKVTKEVFHHVDTICKIREMKVKVELKSLVRLVLNYRKV